MGLGPSQLTFTILKPEEVPEATSARWAVLGRSNAGKSTFLNALIHPQTLFYTGKKPGKTRGLIGVKAQLARAKEAVLELVDLPGFGYAKGHSIQSEGWDVLAEALRERSRDYGLHWVWLADPTRVPEELEADLRAWLHQEPYIFVFTKSDTCSPKARSASERAWKSIIMDATEGPFWVSAKKGEGMDALLKSARQFVRGAAT
jgi:GTP-binding protein